MRKVVAAVVAAILVAAVAAPALAVGTAPRAKVGNYYFHPGKLTIKRGTKVTWRFVSGYHDVTVQKGPVKFTSGGKLFGHSWSHVFKKAGTYHLYCRIHKWMKETIVVK
jgi:plastocyanin